MPVDGIERTVPRMAVFNHDVQSQTGVLRNGLHAPACDSPQWSAECEFEVDTRMVAGEFTKIDVVCAEKACGVR